MRSERYSQWFGLLLVLSVTAFFLFYQVGQWPPPYPRPEESAAGKDALAILRGDIRLSYPDQGGGGVLWVYLTALAFSLLESDLFTLRLLASASGFVAVIITFALSRRLLSQEGSRYSTTWTAILAAAWQGLSLWHIGFTRVGWPPTLIPVLLPLAFYLFWGALQHQSDLQAIAAGALLGMTLYGYIPGMAAIPLAIVFLTVEWVVARWERRPSLISAQRRRVIAGALALGLISLPFILLVTRSPQHFLERPGRVADMASTSAFSQWAHGFRATLEAFGLSTGWLSGRPPELILTPITTLFLWIGLIIVIVRWRRPVCLFLLLWWAIALIPSILAPPTTGDPTVLRRTFAADPVVYILAGLGLAECLKGLARLAKRISRIQHWSVGAQSHYLFLAMLLLFLAVATPQSFQGLKTWAAREASSHLYLKSSGVYLAEWMREHTDSDTAFLSPVPAALGSTTRPWFYTAAFLYQEDAPFATVADDAMAAQTLTDLTMGKTIVHLIFDTSHPIDPRGYIPFLMATHGALVDEQSVNKFQIQTYRLRSASTDFTDLPALQATLTSFEGVLALTGYAFGDASGADAIKSPSAPSGERVWLELQWHKLSETDADYKAAVFLEDDAGHIVGHTDTTLFSSIFYQRTSEWPVGQQEVIYLLLPIAPGTVPGDYHLRLILYEAEGGTRLMPEGGRADLSIGLGMMKVKPSLRPPAAEELRPDNVLDVSIGTTLRLMGYDVDADSPLHPGDSLRLTFYWQADKETDKDYQLSLWLEDGTYSIRLLDQPQSLGGLDYPTSMWRPGERLRTWTDGRLPLDATEGRYTLGLHVSPADNSIPVGRISLGQIEVASRTPVFEPPPISHSTHATFQAAIRLLGYDLSLVGGESPGLDLTLYWQPLVELQTSYVVFIHILNPDGEIVAQRDSLPVDGTLPTLNWVPGEIVVDPHRIPAPGNLPAGSYKVSVGLYDARTGRRLLSDATDELTLTTIEVP